MTKIRQLISTTCLSFVFFIFLSITSQANANIDLNPLETNHPHIQQEKKHLTIGILSFRSKAVTKLQWQPLLDYLNQHLPNAQLSLEALTFAELNSRIENKTIDFLLTNSGNYVQLTHRFGLSAPLASLINSENDTPTSDFGGVIVTRKDNQSITQLKDLKGKRVATPSVQSFGGYMVQAYEFQQAGFNLNKDLKFVETGMPHDTAITALLNQQVDAAFIRTGVLESLRENSPAIFNQLKAINQPIKPSPFILSTRLYPEWPFAAMPHTDKIIAGQITGLLLTLEHGRLTTEKTGIHGFSIPADYEPIREVLRALRVYPYTESPEFTYQDIWAQYTSEIIVIALVALIIILLSINLVSANTRLKHHQQQLQEQATSLAIAAVAFNTEQAILITTPDEKIIRVNQAFSEITGYQPNDVIGKTPRIFKSNYHPVDFYQNIWGTLKKEGFWQGEIWNRRKSGEIYPVGQSIKAITFENGEISHYLSTFTDITLFKENESKIQKLAFYDPLTQLANRRLLKDHLTQLMAISERDQFYFAVLFIDLDNFKTLNDTLGHQYGDLLLQHLAKRLMACVREGDTVSRPGGDEFILLLSNISTEHQASIYQSQRIADKILTEIAKPYDLKGTQYTIGASIGITICNGRKSTAEELMKHSDLAMYQSKNTGKNTITFFDPEMQVAVEKRSELEHDLRMAITQQQFKLFYQPKISSAGNLIGFEALIRWQHPEKGLIPPNDFIPVAEETGLILEIGQWVIESACRQLKKWANNSTTQNLSIAVNISERQLKQINFVEQTLQSIEQYGINFTLLEFEITESQLMENIGDSVQKMKALQEKGITFSLDDFGTGYSSLVYLKNLPITTLKIDQSFVRDMLDNSESRAIVQTIISLAQTLGLKLVAEGVETTEQKAFLIEAGCHYLQGYLLGRPAPIEEIIFA